MSSGFFQPAKRQREKAERKGNGKAKNPEIDASDREKGKEHGDDDVSNLYAPAYRSALANGKAATDSDSAAPAKAVGDAEAADKAAAGDAKCVHHSPNHSAWHGHPDL